RHRRVRAGLHAAAQPRFWGGFGLAESLRIEDSQDFGLFGVVTHSGDVLGDLAQRPLFAARLVRGRGPGRLVTEYVPAAEPPQLGACLVVVRLGEPGPVGI